MQREAHFRFAAEKASVSAEDTELDSQLCPVRGSGRRRCYQRRCLRISTTSETTVYAALRACSYSSLPG